MTHNSTEIKNTRKFGIVALIFFGLLCSLALWRSKPGVATFFAVLALLGLSFIAFPAQMKPAHDAWVKVAHLIGKTINITLLTIVYFLVITPFAILMKILRQDPLHPKTEDKTTYWVTRQETAQPKDRFYNRY